MESYRSVLEVLKFSVPKHVLTALRYIHRVWATAGLCNELWDLYSELEHLPTRYKHISAFEAYLNRRTQCFSLVLFHYEQAVVFDCLTETTISKWSCVAPPEQSQWVLYSNHVITTGGLIAPATPITGCLLYPPEDQMTSSLMQGMTTPRYRHSAIIYRKVLYVFGGMGRKTALCSAEKLDLFPVQGKIRKILAGREWAKIANLSGNRKDMSLCSNFTHIYICGVADEAGVIIEKYSPRYDRYEVLPVSLPVYSCMSSVVLGDELLLLSSTRLTEVSISLTPQYTEQESAWEFHIPANMNAIAVNSFIYRVSKRGIEKCDVEHRSSAIITD